MKSNKKNILILIIPIILIVIIMVSLFGLYVYIGTYIFPIAPYWITQLPPNPPTPKIKYGEFNFKLTYSMEGETKELSDVIICEFKGFEVVAIGDSKKRVWSEYLKNQKGYELFRFRDEKREGNEKTYSAICIENIDNYKVILDIAQAEWFLGEPAYQGTNEMPYIQVFDTSTGYYKDSKESELFLDRYDFKVLEWYCDPPIQNSFR